MVPAASMRFPKIQTIYIIWNSSFLSTLWRARVLISSYPGENSRGGPIALCGQGSHPWPLETELVQQGSLHLGTTEFLVVVTKLGQMK